MQIDLYKVAAECILSIIFENPLYPQKFGYMKLKKQDIIKNKIPLWHKIPKYGVTLFRGFRTHLRNNNK